MAKDLKADFIKEYGGCRVQRTDMLFNLSPHLLYSNDGSTSPHINVV